MNTLNIATQPDTNLLERAERIGRFIGGTPLFPLNHINPNRNVQLYAKLEWQQFGGSVKARPAYRIIRDAIASGHLDGSRRLLDASSGNTGIAYAHIAAALGIKVTLCLPENASEERKRILKALGVDIRFTSRTGTTDEAQEIARELYNGHPEQFFLVDEHRNVDTEKAHKVVKKAVHKEGLILSPSSAANLAGALELAEELEEGTVVTVFPDDGSKYGEILTELF